MLKKLGNSNSLLKKAPPPSHKTIGNSELEDAIARRKSLVAWNQSENSLGHDCSNCVGVCCTFVANSVRVTPLEAMDLKRHLESKQQWNQSLALKLEDNIKRYQLDRPEPGDGRRSYGRRRYTCPFFGESTLGCPFPTEVKPYGCLGFHPAKAGVKEGEHCRSETSLLGEREFLVSDESHRCIELEQRLGWASPTLPIPVALLSLMDKGLGVEN